MSPAKISNPPPGRPFDLAISEKLQAAIAPLFTEHPELRSVGVCLDYVGKLNEADVARGVWLGPEGIVADPAAVVGSAQACTNLLGMILQRAQQLHEHLGQEIHQQLLTLRELHENQQEKAAPDRPGPA